MSKTLKDELLEVILMERFKEEIKVLSNELCKLINKRIEKLESLSLELTNIKDSSGAQKELYGQINDLERALYIAEANPLTLSFTELQELGVIKYNRKEQITSLLTYMKSLDDKKLENDNAPFDIEHLQEGIKALSEFAKNFNLKF